MTTGTLNKKTPKGEQKNGQQQYREEKQTHFSEETLQKFAQAEEAVGKVLSSYVRKLGQAENRDKARELQSKYQQKMAEAIEETGLSWYKYSKIFQTLQADSSLRDKINHISFHP